MINLTLESTGLNYSNVIYLIDRQLSSLFIQTIALWFFIDCRIFKLLHLGQIERQARKKKEGGKRAPKKIRPRKNKEKRGRQKKKKKRKEGA